MIRIGTALDENLNHLMATYLGSNVQRSLPLWIFLVRISSGIEEELDRGLVSFLGINSIESHNTFFQ